MSIARTPTYPDGLGGVGRGSVGCAVLLCVVVDGRGGFFCVLRTFLCCFCFLLECVSGVCACFLFGILLVLSGEVWCCWFAFVCRGLGGGWTGRLIWVLISFVNERLSSRKTEESVAIP